MWTSACPQLVPSRGVAQLPAQHPGRAVNHPEPNRSVAKRLVGSICQVELIDRGEHVSGEAWSAVAVVRKVPGGALAPQAQRQGPEPPAPTRDHATGAQQRPFKPVPRRINTAVRPPLVPEPPTPPRSRRLAGCDRPPSESGPIRGAALEWPAVTRPTTRAGCWRCPLRRSASSCPL
jgi:hypothetical protein